MLKRERSKLEAAELRRERSKREAAELRRSSRSIEGSGRDQSVVIPSLKFIWWRSLDSRSVLRSITVTDDRLTDSCGNAPSLKSHVVFACISYGHQSPYPTSRCDHYFDGSIDNMSSGRKAFVSAPLDKVAITDWWLPEHAVQRLDTRAWYCFSVSVSVPLRFYPTSRLHCGVGVGPDDCGSSRAASRDLSGDIVDTPGQTAARAGPILATSRDLSHCIVDAC